jgi:dTDP-4-dehydrorhamnose reductase
MKYAIESQFFGNSYVKFFRLSYVFSNTDKFMNYLVSCAEKGECAKVFDALYRNVIYVDDIIDAVFKLRDSFSSWNNQLFNLSGNELLSRKNLAELYKSEVDPSLQYTIMMPDAEFFTARPNIIETKSLYLEALLGRKPMSIREAMRKEFRKV